MPIIYTLGHSNHKFSNLLAILHRHNINLVADIRRYPTSRHNPQYNKPQLAAELEQARVKYCFFGKKLGGKEAFDKIRAKPEFDEGISELIELASQGIRIAVLCAEEDPRYCHRHQLLEPEFAKRGVRLVHIRSNGQLEEIKQLNLFLK